MRTIKFRGKRIDNGEWVYGHYYTGTMTDAPYCLNDCRTCHVIIVDGIFYHVDPTTIGQFTGLTDTNGKEIYEGDICNCEYNYDDKRIIKDAVSYYGGSFYPLCNMPSIYFEVIGTIHDNPELI